MLTENRRQGRYFRMTTSKFLRRWFSVFGYPRLLLPLVLYTCVALFITWPLATQLSTHVVGFADPDSFENARLGWWGSYALQHGLNPFYQSMLGYPNGFFSSVQWSQPLMYWPISLIGLFADPAAAFNLWILLEVILSGVTGYRLCLAVIDRHDTTDWSAMLAALLGGLVFMAFPTMQAHLIGGQINPLANYALPVLLLALYRIIEGHGGLRIAMLGTMSLWVLLLGNYTALIFSILPIVVFGGGYLLMRWPRSVLNRLVLRDLALVFGGGILLTVPFYMPIIAEALSPQPPSYLQQGGAVYFSSDVLNFAALSPFTPWTEKFAPSFSWLILNENPVEGTAYLGLAASTLAVIALLGNRRKAALWLVIALGCMLFSLGPELKFHGQPIVYTIDGNTSNLVLPWALFQNLPLVKITRTPGRFNFTTGLALSVLAALGLEALLRLMHQRAMLSAVAAALAVLTVAEYQVRFPFPTTSAVQPAYFSELATRSDVRAVFDIPWDDAAAQRAALFEQSVHHKPIIAGYVSRGTSVDPAKLTVLSDMLIGKAWDTTDSTGSAPGQAIAAEDARAILNSMGIDVVVYHWGTLNKEGVLGMAHRILGMPAYQDSRLAIFDVPRTAQQPHGLVAAFSSDGWWQPKNAATSHDIFWMTGNSSLYFYAPSTTDTRLDLNLLPILQKRGVDVTLDGQVFRSWTLESAVTRIGFFLHLASGFHDLHFTFKESCTPLPVAPACLLDKTAANGFSHDLSFADPACDLGDQSDPLNRVCVTAGFGTLLTQNPGPMAFHDHVVQLSSGLSLRGFRLPAEATAGQPFAVETVWHAAQKLPGDYHFSLYAVDAQNKLVAQYDNIPNGGTYPTAQWAVPQDWTESDTLLLPADLTPGIYRILAGWYRYPDMQRLSVEGNDPGASDGLVFLGEVQVTPSRS